MASTPISSSLYENSLEPYERPGYGKLSVLNGLLIGLALAVGSWGFEAIRLSGVPIENGYTSLLLGSLSLIALGGFAGWLTGKVARSWFTIISWTLVAVISALLIGYQPYIGRTIAEWLADRQAWGLPIYSAQGITNSGLILGSLAIIVVLVILALLQSHRLEQAVNELGEGARMSARSWFILLLPMPFVMLVAYFTSSVQVNPASQAANAVYDAIEVARTTEGDLFQLGIQRGSNYGALNAVRDQLTADYSLRIGEVEPNTSQTFILAEFDSGAWINCRTINDQLSFCYDASPPYTIGLTYLIRGETPPDDCRGCQIQVDETLASWLQARATKLGSDFVIERLGQWGGYVKVAAGAADGSYMIECLFDKMSPVRLASCEEVEP